MPVLSQVKTTLGAFGESTFSSGIANRSGVQVVLDFYTYAALIGAGYQVRAGTITTPLVGAVTISATGAEMCVDAAATANVIIPTRLGIGVRLAGGTLFEMAAKSVATASTAGAAFVPLPLRSDAGAATSTARVAAAGGVTVTTELATTTLRHWDYANPVAAGAGNDPGLVAATAAAWNPKVPPVLRGPRCFYVQIAATTTGPSYYADFDFLEFLAAAIL